MASEDNTLLANIFGWSGTVVACFFFISPIVLFIEMTKTGSHVKIPGLMLLFNTFSTCLWVIYGLAGAGTQVWVCNGIGLVFSTVYVLWYIPYRVEKIIFKILFELLAVVLIGGLVTVGVIAKKEEDFADKIKDIVGYIALVVNAIMFAAPGQNLYIVFKTGNYELIPIVSSLVGLVNCVLWFMFSLTKFDAIDYTVMVPNAIGIPLFIVQAAVWLYYYNKRKEEGTDGSFHKIDNTDI
mmetsp:Transcript_17609/g.18256  ORF Transcript_17609/g.18256 Transcript_17609/m.18256 type:complete len:239 (-) Transcript_17609:48-764(-)